MEDWMIAARQVRRDVKRWWKRMCGWTVMTKAGADGESIDLSFRTTSYEVRERLVSQWSKEGWVRV